jgi:AcrR family transcriptional regulator
MTGANTYRRGRPAGQGDRTRARIVDAVRGALMDGTFHESTVEQLADRAKIARATMYTHFRSRLDLIDAVCRTFDANPALLALRDAVRGPDPVAAAETTLRLTVEFWSSERGVLAALYDSAALDPSARALVERQRADRRGEMARLAALLDADGFRAGLLADLMLLTSFDSYRELAREGLSDPAIVAGLTGILHRLLGR